MGDILWDPWDLCGLVGLGRHFRHSQASSVGGKETAAAVVLEEEGEENGHMAIVDKKEEKEEKAEKEEKEEKEKKEKKEKKTAIWRSLPTRYCLKWRRGSEDLRR